ncbi:MAG: hypothetical protein LIO46_06325 [Clostridiales bacterium]|nr:hypothetical protein [Clostridiales bacterium]
MTLLFKELFGSDVLSYEAFAQRLEACDTIKLANLADGGYVSAEKYRRKVRELEQVRRQLKEIQQRQAQSAGHRPVQVQSVCQSGCVTVTTTFCPCTQCAGPSAANRNKEA